MQQNAANAEMVCIICSQYSKLYYSIFLNVIAKFLVRNKSVLIWWENVRIWKITNIADKGFVHLRCEVPQINKNTWDQRRGFGVWTNLSSVSHWILCFGWGYYHVETWYPTFMPSFILRLSKNLVSIRPNSGGRIQQDYHFKDSVEIDWCCFEAFYQCICCLVSF